MRQFGALRRSRRSANSRKSNLINRSLAGPSTCAIAALLLSACHAHTPRSDHQAQAAAAPKPAAHLMTKEAAPACLYTEAAADTGEPPSLVQKAAVVSASAQHLATVGADDAAQRRERERDCFRDAEARVRKKLSQLQAAVRTSQRATERETSPASR